MAFDEKYAAKLLRRAADMLENGDWRAEVGECKVDLTALSGGWVSMRVQARVGDEVWPGKD